MPLPTDRTLESTEEEHLDDHLALAEMYNDFEQGYVSESVIEEPGDLIVGAAAGVVNRVPLGTNGHVLTADSATDDGVKWAAVPIAAGTKGFVNHGATAGTARPSGFASIEWYGSVEPTNAIDGDTWIDTST